MEFINLFISQATVLFKFSILSVYTYFIYFFVYNMLFNHEAACHFYFNSMLPDDIKKSQSHTETKK